MILFSLVSVSDLSYNYYLLNDLQTFDIKACMLFSFGCFLLFLSLIIASDINVSNCSIAAIFARIPIPLPIKLPIQM